MQKWEYLIMECMLYNNSWKPWRIDGTVIDNWNKLNLGAKINELGENGWELIINTNYMRSTIQDWIFKRPKFLTENISQITLL